MIPPVARRLMLWETHALCLDGKACGLRPLAGLVPDENDPPGLCDRCGGQTCNCPGCVDHGLYSPAGLAPAVPAMEGVS